ncbi:Kinesin-like protein unc-104 [Diplonema papillatum]|nr:Kinesin-like protein unc-104 [Diplonema papillatum]
MADGNAVTVAVRIRPMNKRELESTEKRVIKVVGGTTVVLERDEDRDRSHKWTFDHVWDSSNLQHPSFASQEKVFYDFGSKVLKASFDGFNASIFAYGQTGSGKTYCMMGVADDAEQKGIIPRLCTELFKRIADHQDADPSHSYTVTMSFLEIYMEKVKDLIDPAKVNLRVREHPSKGPYVDNLTTLSVEKIQDVLDCIEHGNKARHIAATQMNATSSRSHAVFSLEVTHTVTTQLGGCDEDVVQSTSSKIVLVDLAGSERQKSTGATGERLAEGSQINKSLTTLGLVINALAELSKETTKKGGVPKHVPYRDSTLTYLLKDTLGGNSKTFMISTISPAAAQYEETMSTLRYADRAKSIVTKAVVNEDPIQKMIKALQAEVDQYKQQVEQYRTTGGSPAPGTAVDPDEFANAKVAEMEKLYSAKITGYQEKIRTLESNNQVTAELSLLQQQLREKEASWHLRQQELEEKIKEAQDADSRDRLIAEQKAWANERGSLTGEIEILRQKQQAELRHNNKMLQEAQDKIRKQQQMIEHNQRAWEEDKKRLQSKVLSEMEEVVEISMQTRTITKELEAQKTLLTEKERKWKEENEKLSKLALEKQKEAEQLSEERRANEELKKELQALRERASSRSSITAGNGAAPPSPLTYSLQLLQQQSKDFTSRTSQFSSRYTTEEVESLVRSRQEKYDSLSNKLAELKKAEAGLPDLREAVLKATEERAEKLKDPSAKVEALQKEEQAARDKAAGLAERVNQQQATDTENQKLLAKNKAKIKELKADIERLRAEEKNLAKKKGDLQRDVFEAEEDLTDLIVKQKKLEKQQTAELLNTSARSTTSSDSKPRITPELAELNRQVDEKEEALRELKAYCAETSRAGAASKKALEAVPGIAAAAEKLEKANKALMAHSIDFFETEGELLKAQGTVRKLETNRTKAEKEYAARDDEYSSRVRVCQEALTSAEEAGGMQARQALHGEIQRTHTAWLDELEEVQSPVSRSASGSPMSKSVTEAIDTAAPDSADLKKLQQQWWKEREKLSEQVGRWKNECQGLENALTDNKKWAAHADPNEKLVLETELQQAKMRLTHHKQFLADREKQWRDIWRKAEDEQNVESDKLKQELQDKIKEVQMLKERVQTVEEPSGPPRWVPNDSVTACSCCKRPFGLLRRKHHCRKCGEVVCASCSPKRVALSISSTSVRVCARCCSSV